MAQAASLLGADLFSQNMCFFEQATCPGQLRCPGQRFFSKYDFFLNTKVQFQLLINKPEFELVLMSDGGGDFYAVSYGANARVYNDGLKTATVVSPIKMYRKSPKDWVQKREPYDFEVRYFKRSEDEKGVLEAKINGETTVKLTTDKYRKGFAGFRWNDTKFIVQELEVRGLVDEEWAKAELNKSPEESSGGGDDDFDF